MSNCGRFHAKTGGAFIFTLSILCVQPALADQIDGDWCSANGKRLSIDGPSIVTPGGTKMTGNYDRHNFSYTIPVPEQNAGSRIEMSQQNEQTMLLRRRGANNAAAPVETWKRCAAIS